MSTMSTDLEISNVACPQKCREAKMDIADILRSNTLGQCPQMSTGVIDYEKV